MSWPQQTAKVVGSGPKVRVEVDASRCISQIIITYSARQGSGVLWWACLFVSPLTQACRRNHTFKLYQIFMHVVCAHSTISIWLGGWVDLGGCLRRPTESDSWPTDPHNKKLSYRRKTARCVLSVVILQITTQQCRNYLYDKSWPNRWYEVGGLVGGNAW